MQPYTLLITSCRRHGLLSETLDSFEAQVDIEPQATVIVEDGVDSPRPGWLNRYKRLGEITWLENGARKGQLYSADRLWKACQTQYAFWSEDDWRYTDTGFIQKSYDILKDYPEVLTVSLRGWVLTNWHPLVADARFPFTVLSRDFGGGWGAFSFNCGLRRKSDWQRAGESYAALVEQTHNPIFERELSKIHIDLGYVIPDIGKYIEHTGGDRSCYREDEWK